MSTIFLRINHILTTCVAFFLCLISGQVSAEICPTAQPQPYIFQTTVNQYYDSPEKLWVHTTKYSHITTYFGHRNHPTLFIGIGSYSKGSCWGVHSTHIWSRIAESYRDKRGTHSISDNLGNKMAEVSFDENGATGKFRVWFSTGELAQEGHYKNNRKEGVFKLWHSDGQLMYEGLFENGESVGIHIWIKRGGRKWIEYDFNDKCTATKLNQSLGRATLKLPKISTDARPILLGSGYSENMISLSKTLGSGAGGKGNR